MVIVLLNFLERNVFIYPKHLNNSRFIRNIDMNLDFFLNPTQKNSLIRVF